MTRSNPFFRRASSPGDHHHENLSPNRPSKLTQASLSDSALKIPPFRPDSLRNTQPRTTTIRPSRFVKVAIPTTSFSSPITSTDETDRTCLSPEMTDFIQLFDLFTQKVYMEGYLMKHDTQKKKKMFAELSGSTLTLWDTELTGASSNIRLRITGSMESLDSTYLGKRETMEASTTLVPSNGGGLHSMRTHEGAFATRGGGSVVCKCISTTLLV